MGKVRLQIPFAERVCVSDRGLASISERNIIEAGALFLRSRNIFVSLTNAVLITLDRVIFCPLFFPPLFSLSLSPFRSNRLVRRMICLPFSFLSSVAFTSIYYAASFRALSYPRARDTERQTVKCGWRDTAETEFCGAKINSVFACQFIANGRPGNS